MSARFTIALAIAFAAVPLSVSQSGLARNESAAGNGGMMHVSPDTPRTFGNGMGMRQMGPDQIQQDRGMGMHNSDNDLGTGQMQHGLTDRGRGRHGGTGRGGGMR
jgi:hypothetical protein